MHTLNTANSSNLVLKGGYGPKIMCLKYINTKAQNQMPNGRTSELSTGVVRQKSSAALPAPVDLIKNTDLDMDNGNIEREQILNQAPWQQLWLNMAVIATWRRVLTVSFNVRQT